MKPLILVEKDGAHTTILTLNRPEKRNALSIDLMTELCKAVKTTCRDQTQRVLVFRGAGDVFCAGLDLKETSELKKAEASAKMISQTLLTIYEAPLVTIAAVHGAAVAGGAGLMTACDFVVAAKETKIGYPEVRRGLVAGFVMTFLRRQLRERDIRELLLTGELINVEHAKDIGLINRITSKEDLMNEVQKISEMIIQGGPQTLAKSKKVLDDLWHTSVKEDIRRTLHCHLTVRKSAEAKEGIAAFLEKRPPKWK